MKRVRGRPWIDLLREDLAKVPVELLLARHLPILIQVAQGVAFAHAVGIVHRDLKPAQVMIGDYGEVVVVDWGLAICMSGSIAESEIVRDGVSPHAVQTQESGTSPSGTPALMAPEQTLSHAREIGPWTDIYLLGGTLYFILTGVLSSPGGEPGISLSCAPTEGKVDPPSARAPQRAIPRQLEELAMQALAPAKADRVPSAGDFIARIQDYLTGATRRRESEAMTTALAAEWSHSDHAAYSDIAAALSRLEQATNLWPGNPAAPELKRTLVEGYATTALGAGDLLLARVQAETLKDDARRGEILSQITRAERALQLQRSTRRIALASVVGLLVVIIVGGWFSFDAVQAEKAAVLRQRGVAETRVLKSQELVNFMLGDLSKSLDRSIDRDRHIAESMTAEVDKFVPALDLASDRPGVQVTHATFLDGLARNFRNLGMKERALEYARLALQMREKHAKDDPIGRSMSLNEVASAMDDLGQNAAAEPLFLEIYELRRKELGPLSKDTLEAAFNYAVCLRFSDNAGEIRAREFLTRVVPESQPAIDSHPYQLSLLEGTLGATFASEGKLEEALKWMLLGREHSTLGGNLQPMQEGNLARNIASAYRMTGRPSLALPLAKEAASVFEGALGPFHPNSSNARLDLIACTLEAGETTEAITLAREWAGRCRKADPPRRKESFESIRILCKALQDGGQPRECLDGLQTIRREFADMLHASETTRRWLYSLGTECLGALPPDDETREFGAWMLEYQRGFPDDDPIQLIILLHARSRRDDGPGSLAARRAAYAELIPLIIAQKKRYFVPAWEEIVSSIVFDCSNGYEEENYARTMEWVAQLSAVADDEEIRSFAAGQRIVVAAVYTDRSKDSPFREARTAQFLTLTDGVPSRDLLRMKDGTTIVSERFQALYRKGDQSRIKTELAELVADGLLLPEALDSDFSSNGGDLREFVVKEKE
jgi:tetratricopeptide (TPR) repeat protein